MTDDAAASHGRFEFLPADDRAPAACGRRATST